MDSKCPERGMKRERTVALGMKRYGWSTRIDQIHTDTFKRRSTGLPNKQLAGFRPDRLLCDLLGSRLVRRGGGFSFEVEETGESSV